MIKRDITLTLLAFGLLSCSNKEQYIIKIEPKAHPMHQQSNITTHKIGIQSLKLPDYLLQYPIAKQISTNKISYLNDHRWAETLDEALKRELINYLQSYASSYEILNYPWGALPDITLDITLHNFIATQKFVDLNATIKVYTHQGDKTMIYRVTYREPFSGQNEDIAPTMNLLYKKFVDKLAKIIIKND